MSALERVARRIGMEPCEMGYWRDEGLEIADYVKREDIPAYLMEPAQTVRILARYPLHLSPVEGSLYVVAGYNVNGELVRECGPVCEAVARCAAKLEAEANG